MALTLSVKEARKHERARSPRRMAVSGRVAASQPLPLLVKIGVRSWKARRVPVGRRLARLAVVVSVWEMALWDKEDCRCGGGFAFSGGAVAVAVAEVVSPLEVVLDLRDISVCVRYD